MLQLDQICVAHDDHRVLENLSLTLEPAQRLGLLGPSGCGKTSVLQLVAGLLSPTAGQLRNDFQRIGYVFQSPRLLPWLSVQDNIAIVLEARGEKRSAARGTARHWLSRLELPDDAAMRWPSQLSGGMAQRVALARAFALEPDLLLLDEPFSALDPALRQQLTNLTDQLLETHQCALLCVSHHPQELAALAPRSLEITGPTEHNLINLTPVFTGETP